MLGYKPNNISRRHLLIIQISSDATNGLTIAISFSINTQISAIFSANKMQLKHQIVPVLLQNMIYSMIIHNMDSIADI